MTQEPTGGYVPADVIAALQPWAFWAPNTALSLAQQQADLGLRAWEEQQRAATAMADVQARLAAPQAQAGASVYGAQVAAQSALDQELIRSKTQLAGIQAQIASDLQRAAGGDQNAANRLQAELGLQAQVANQTTALQLAKMAGSGDLRDNFARLLYLKGYGPQPGVASALQGLPSPFIQAPTVKFSEYGPPPTVEGVSGGVGGFSLPKYAPPQAPSFQMPSVVSLGGGAPPKIDLAFAFTSIYDILKGFAPSLDFGGGGGTAPAAPAPAAAPAAQASPNSAMANYIAQTAGMGVLNDLLFPKAGHGATVRLKSGESIIVGDPVRPGEPNPELATVRWGRYGLELKITPLRKMAYGGTVTSAGGDAAPRRWIDRLGQRYLQRRQAQAQQAAPPPSPPVAPPAVAPPAATPPPDAGRPAAPQWLAHAGAQGIPVSDLPVVRALMTGNAGPAFTAIQRPVAPELGLTQGVPLPFEAATTYRSLSPAEQAQALQLWSYLGIPEDVARYWINVATPGWRTAGLQVGY